MQNAPREHSAVLSICIKRLSVLKTYFKSSFELPLKTGFTACTLFICMHLRYMYQLGPHKICSWGPEMKNGYF